MGKDELTFGDFTVTIPDNRNLKKVHIEITSKCNLNCKMCFRRFWNGGLST